MFCTITLVEPEKLIPVGYSGRTDVNKGNIVVALAISAKLNEEKAFCCYQASSDFFSSSASGNFKNVGDEQHYGENICFQH